MLFTSRCFRGLVRWIGPALAAFALLAGALPSRAATPATDHQSAASALNDLQAAIREIVKAEDSSVSGPDFFRATAQQAMNTLVGSADERYRADQRNPGDATGALGHINHLLDRRETPPWVPALQSALVNIDAAVGHIEDALKVRELMDYQIEMSRALTNLLVALGRSTEMGSLGGLQGAMASTSLGVPDGARVVDGCASPSSAPAYGVHGGYLVFIAIPAAEGSHQIAQNPGGTRIDIRSGTLILYTPAADKLRSVCASHATAAPMQSEPPHAAGASLYAPTSFAVPAPRQMSGLTPIAQSDPPGNVKVSALYAKEQAEAGAKVFAEHCVSCHGANQQGVAAPATAGNSFLQTAKQNRWSFEVIRILVVQNMPFNDPGSLTPKQYTDVLAFLLASNCYPAGRKPLPEKDNPRFAKIVLGPIPGPHPTADQNGVCPVE